MKRKMLMTVGRFLNLFGADLEICHRCDTLQKWDGGNLWGPFFLCDACDEMFADDCRHELGG